MSLKEILFIGLGFFLLAILLFLWLFLLLLRSLGL